jgi:cell shape-determining protein MreC
MPVATFDTLKFANTLKAAGVPPQQAEAEAAAFAEVIQLNFKELVSKDDLKQTEKDVRQEMKDVEQRLTARLDVMTADNRAYQAALRGEMLLLKWMLGVSVTLTAGVAIRLFFFRGTI